MSEFRFKPMENGFTLAELLVVILIIGILVAIAVPVFSNNITRANRTVVEANLKTIDAAIMQYGAANEGAIPKKADDLSTYLQTWPEGPDGVEYKVFKGRAAIAKKCNGDWFGKVKVNDSLPINWEEKSEKTKKDKK